MTNFYVQLDFGQEFSNGMSIEGNVGVRYAQSELTSDGNIVRIPFAAETTCTPGIDGNGVTTTVGACDRNSPQDFLPETTAFLQQAATSISYTNEDEHYLPSLNVKWNLNDDMLIRFGYSQNLTRPNIQDVRAYTTYSAGTVTTPFPADNCSDQGLPDDCNDGFQDISLTQINVGGGNPRLRPTTSDNYDLSFEYYFSGGYFSAAVFQKALQDVISGGSEQVGTVTLDGVTVPRYLMADRSTPAPLISMATKWLTSSSSTSCLGRCRTSGCRRTTPISTLKRRRIWRAPTTASHAASGSPISSVSRRIWRTS